MRAKGYTLLEILIALFIFTIIAILLATALHTVINADTGVAKKAEQMRALQTTFLLLSSDIEQAVNRPVLDAAGKNDLAWSGTPTSVLLTHNGAGQGLSKQSQSDLQRTQWFVEKGVLWRRVFPVVDAAPATKPQDREILRGVKAVQFQYRGKEGQWENYWPASMDKASPLPRAVRVQLTVNEGRISQTYVVPNGTY